MVGAMVGEKRLIAPLATGAGARLLALDGLRGTAALMVVAAHTYGVTTAERGGIEWALVDRAGLGGVVLFFALSGFLLGLPWARAEVEHRPPPTVRDYALRRVLRIFPGYYVSVLALALLRVVVLHKEPLPTQDMLLHFLFLPDFGHSLLTVYWTLQVEELFYWALPVLHRVASRWGMRQLLIAVALISAGWAIGAMQWAPWTNIPLAVWWSQTPFFLPAFVLGLGAARLYAKQTTSSRARTLAVVGWCGYLVWTPVAFWADRRFGELATPPMGLVLAPFATAIVLSTAWGAQDVFRNGVLRFFGLISFSLYLWHLVIIRNVPLPAIVGDSFWTRLPLTVVMSGALSFVLYLAVERPFLRLRPRAATFGQVPCDGSA
jgi:peptidoglycan/LPS O-acetylase OafA/YrhL